MINQFQNEFRFLSNYFPSPIKWNNCWWTTVEHAFQAAKSKDSDEREAIRTAPTPGAAKKLGRCVHLPTDWEEIKILIMSDLVWLKFEQNLNLRSKLLSTGESELVEGNYWHDNFWGDCSCSKCSGIKGKNFLGIILMEVRFHLRIRDNLRE